MLLLFPRSKFMNNSGSLMLMMLVITGIVGIICMWAGSFLQQRLKTAIATRDSMGARVALTSVMTYTANAIKHRVCLGSTLELGGTGTCDGTNDLVYDGNTERLLFNDNNIEFITDAAAAASMTLPAYLPDVRLGAIHRSVNLSTITSSHPLYQILNPISSVYQSVDVTIDRLDNAVEPTKGEEVLLRIAVKLIPAVAYGASVRPKFLESKIVVYPRQLSTFSLILPGNLVLDPGVALNPGDVKIPLQSIPNSDPSKGIRFESPVFVNGSLYLPPPTSTDAGVSFVDKVYLGGEVDPATGLVSPGVIRQSGSTFQPASAGAPGDVFSYETHGFSGLLGGIENDPEIDLGLRFLFGLDIPSSPVSPAGMGICLQRTLAANDLTITRDTQLFTWVKNANTTAALSSYDTILNLGKVDIFVPQQLVDSNGVPNPNLNFVMNSDIPGMNGFVPSHFPAYNGDPIMRVKVTLVGLQPIAKSRGTYFVEALLPHNGQVELFPSGSNSSSDPKITITTNNHMFLGHRQNGQADVNISFTNVSALDIQPYFDSATSVTNSPQVFVDFEAFDYGYSAANNVRDSLSDRVPTYTQNSVVHTNVINKYKVNGFAFTPNGTHDQMLISYKGDGASDVGPTSLSWSTNPSIDTSSLALPTFDGFQSPNNGENPEATDFTALDVACLQIPPDSNTFFHAYPAANWGASFAQQAKTVWQFVYYAPLASNPPSMNFGTMQAGKFGYNNSTIQIGGLLKEATGDYPTLFRVESLVKECEIPSSVNFVAGLFTCEKLTIKARTTPLRIIGTIIAGDLDIDPTAITSGIRWSSIFSASAKYELQRARVLFKKQTHNLNHLIDAADKCDMDNPGIPAWNTHPNINALTIHHRCSPLSLNTADPFTWTMVDPDCAIYHDPSGSTPDQIKCQKRPKRFTVREISRTGDL